MRWGFCTVLAIEITSQGTLSELANINNLCARIPSIPGAGLWLTYRSGTRSNAYLLSRSRVRFEGNFPFAKLTFPDLPVDLTLYCWSPFVLHDLRHSAYAAAIFCPAQVNGKSSNGTAYRINLFAVPTDGFIPHDLGGTSGIADSYRVPATAVHPEPSRRTAEPKGGRSAYPGYWVNLPIKFCLEVARNYQWTGDKAFLQEMWPHVKRAITWINAQDEDSDGLPETSYGYDANQWNAMLLAVARLARDLDEPDYANELLSIQKRAFAQIEKLIWTGSYYRQSAKAGPGTRDCDWVSILQLAGTWYADILGFDDGIPNDHARTAMQTMDRVLGGLAAYGLADCPYWLLRDMRMGAAMVMSYAAAGLKLDIPALKAEISPADWVWKDAKFMLPILFPRWLGQVTYTRTAREEVYAVTNLAQPLAQLPQSRGQIGSIRA